MYKIVPLLSTTLLKSRTKDMLGYNVVKLASTKRSSSTVNPEEEPIKYSTSPAWKHRAETTRRGRLRNARLWYEPYVITVSFAVFMIYFTVIREENDIDEELNRSLYSRIKGLEEHQLKLSLEYNREHELDTKDIINRLAEIEREKQRGTYQN